MYTHINIGKNVKFYIKIDSFHWNNHIKQTQWDFGIQIAHELDSELSSVTLYELLHELLLVSRVAPGASFLELSFSTQQWVTVKFVITIKFLQY